MHSVMRSDFLNRFLSLDRFQRDSRLHVCAETPPLPRFHSAPFRGSRFYTLFTGPNFGEQLTPASSLRADSSGQLSRMRHHTCTWLSSRWAMSDSSGGPHYHT